MADLVGLGHPAERDGALDRGDAGRRRRSGRSVCSVRHRPDVDRVDPHLRGPLDGQRSGQASPGRPSPRRTPRSPGEGRSAETEEMFTIDAAGVLALHHRVGRLGHEQRREQVELDDLVVEPRRGLGGERVRRPARVVDQDVEPAVLGDERRRPSPATASGSRTSHCTCAACPATGARPRSARRSPPWRRRRGRPRRSRRRCPGAAGDQGDAAGEVQRQIAHAGTVGYQANAWLSTPTGRMPWPSPPSSATTASASSRWTIPPVNALPVAGLVRRSPPRSTTPAPTRRPRSSCCAPRARASTPASTSRRCSTPRASTP